MIFLILQLVVLIGINTIFYYQAKKYGTYQSHHILLVSVPKKEYDSNEVQNIVSSYQKELLKRYLLTFITIPILFLSKFYLVLYYLVIMWINIMFINLTLKKYRQQLLELKKKNNWPSTKSKTIKIDLKLSALMEQKGFHYKKYMLVLLLDCICLGCMLYFHSHLDQYPFLAIQFIVLGGGLYFITKMPNKTYCDDTRINLAINSLKQNYISFCFFTLTLIDALFYLSVQLFLVDRLPFSIIFIILMIAFVNIILVLQKSQKYQKQKTELLQNHEEYTIDDDDCWKIGLLGPSYYNETNPKTLVSSPLGNQMIFNTAKPAYKVFVTAIWAIILAFVLWIFGYPYYLDITHQLVDVTIENNSIMVDSPFYDVTIPLDTINDIEITEDLGNGIRTNGTDAIIYTHGHCTYDRYGKCLVYKANLHPCFLIIYSDNETYIINDNNINDTKQLYYTVKEVIK